MSTNPKLFEEVLRPKIASDQVLLLNGRFCFCSTQIRGNVPTATFLTRCLNAHRIEFSNLQRGKAFLVLTYEYKFV